MMPYRDFKDVPVERPRGGCYWVRFDLDGAAKLVGRESARGAQACIWGQVYDGAHGLADGDGGPREVLQAAEQARVGVVRSRAHAAPPPAAGASAHAPRRAGLRHHRSCHVH